VGTWTDIFVRVVFQRVSDLVAELLGRGSPTSDTTSVVLASGLEHHDPDVRRLAGVLCMLTGVNPAMVAHSLRVSFEQDDDLLLKAIALAALGGLASMPEDVAAAADDLVRAASSVFDDPMRDDPEPARLLPGRVYLLLRAPTWIGRDRARRLLS